MASDREITEILIAHSRGETGTGKKLLPLVYDALRRLASDRVVDNLVSRSIRVDVPNFTTRPALEPAPALPFQIS